MEKKLVVEKKEWDRSRGMILSSLKKDKEDDHRNGIEEVKTKGKVGVTRLGSFLT